MSSFMCCRPGGNEGHEMDLTCCNLVHVFTAYFNSCPCLYKEIRNCLLWVTSFFSSFFSLKLAMFYHLTLNRTRPSSKIFSTTGSNPQKTNGAVSTKSIIFFSFSQQTRLSVGPIVNIIGVSRSKGLSHNTRFFLLLGHQ